MSELQKEQPDLQSPADAVSPERAACLWGLLSASAVAWGGKPALRASGRPALTYAALQLQVAATAATLRRLGLRRQDIVAVVLPNGPEMAAAFLGVAACAACAPLNPSFRSQEFEYYLGDLKPSALIIETGSVTPARPAAEKLGIPVIELAAPRGGPAGSFQLSGRENGRDAAPAYAQPEDLALMLHTSGTTSRPKMVPLTHQNLCASAAHVRQTLALGPEDVCLNIMPLFHIHGLVAALLASVSAGAGVVCAPGFLAPEFLGWLEEFRPTWYTAVPTMHQTILLRAQQEGRRMVRSSLRLVRSSSSALPAQTMQGLEELFGVPVLEAYGMTEAAHQIACNPRPPGRRTPGSVGLPAGPQVAILGEHNETLAPDRIGEIVIRGPNVTTGYCNNPEANAAAFVDGWFRTGDQGFFDDRGYLHLTGRIKELINRGGEKIAPREIDEVLLHHPAVQTAVAFPVPDPVLGEEIGAAIVLREGQEATPGELQRFVAARLADFKVPRHVLLVPEIPKGATGKVQRIGLAATLGLTGQRAKAAVRPAEFVPARNPTEVRLAALWSGILRVKTVGVRDHFFYAGGDSVLAEQLMIAIEDEFGVRLSLPALLESPTIEQLAVVVAPPAPGPSRGSDAGALLDRLAQMSEAEALRQLAEEEQRRASDPPAKT